MWHVRQLLMPVLFAAAILTASRPVVVRLVEPSPLLVHGGNDHGQGCGQEQHDIMGLVDRVGASVDLRDGVCNEQSLGKPQHDQGRWWRDKVVVDWDTDWRLLKSCAIG